MKKLLLTCSMFLCLGLNLKSQTTETFETETSGSTTFSNNGQNFTITNGVGETAYDIENFTGAGWNGTGGDNKFIDNSGGVTTGNGSSFSISTTDGTEINIKSFYLYQTIILPMEARQLH